LVVWDGSTADHQFLRCGEFVPAFKMCQDVPRLLLALNVPFRELQQEPGLEVFAQEVKAMAAGSTDFLNWPAPKLLRTCARQFSRWCSMLTWHLVSNCGVGEKEDIALCFLGWL